MNRAPVNTYRLQMGAQFGFRDACGIVEYLDRLGITDVYLSPILAATSQSTHGYDVCDPTVLDPRLGTRSDFEDLSDELRSRDMGLILDIVPNHMAASVENPWWRDVLTRGRASDYADFFDISWEAGGGKLLLPVLGAPLEDVLAAGELTIERGELCYWDHRFPLDPACAVPVGACESGTVSRLLEQQHYRLAHWREQATNINYRRFFDISGLVAMRVERENVFQAMHSFVLELVREGRVTGLRIDHVDGLYDPRAYLERLQQALVEASGSAGPFWVVVEKILNSPLEQLPREWPVAGTTGYDFLDAADGLLVEPAGARRLQRFYDQLCGERQSFDEIVLTEKRRVMRTLFGSELRMLGASLAQLLADRALPQEELVEAIVEVTTHLPVYRTYVDQREGVSDSDRAFIEGAVAQAPPSRAVRALHKVLLTEPSFTMRWQQFCGPVTAKAVEDTAFYRYYALPERNEVGAHPGEPLLSARLYDVLMRRRRDRTPHTMNTTSTHDTKRGESVRARLAALTHQPDEWMHLVRQLRLRYPEPDPHDAYLVYSTILGAYPIEPERLREYLVKAAREAKRLTSWTDPDARYEQRLLTFAELVRGDPDLVAYAERIVEPGRRLALSLMALKLVASGVCDVYQGSEIEQLTLVDPDNRRPVDFALRRGVLRAVDEGLPPPEGATEADLQRMRLLAVGLRQRRNSPDQVIGANYLELAERAAVAAFELSVPALVRR